MITQSESINNFRSQVTLLLRICPQIQQCRTVFLLDGCQAMITVVEQMIRNNLIILCLYHFSENVKKRVLPWLLLAAKKHHDQSEIVPAPISQESIEILVEQEGEDEDSGDKIEELLSTIDWSDANDNQEAPDQEEEADNGSDHFQIFWKFWKA